MKKIRDMARFLRNQNRAQRRSVKERIRQVRRSAQHGSSTGIVSQTREPGKQVIVVAPKILSLSRNPEGMVDFIRNMVGADKPKHDICLDLDNVEEVTLDAILLMVSQIKGRVIHRCRSIGGKQPKNVTVREFLSRSGFYSHFSNPPADYHAEQNRGYLKRREGKKVQEDIAQELIHYANEKLFGEPHRPNKGIYRMLIECMANTRDHASRQNKESESWWLAVYHDKERGVVNFAFLDNGVGLFESVRLEGFFKSFGALIGVYDRVSLLLDILDGKVSSPTGIPYRGKGLPGIYTAMQRGFFTNLNIVSNNVVLDAGTRKGRIFSPPFRGTSYTWEVRQ